MYSIINTCKLLQIIEPFYSQHPESAEVKKKKKSQIYKGQTISPVQLM